MKKNIKIYKKGKLVDKEINYIPTRYIIAILITILEVLSIIAIVVALAIYVPYFYFALVVTEIIVIVSIMISNNNPDYKLVWLFVVVMIPLGGLMIYLIFYRRKLPKKAVKRLERVKTSYLYTDEENFNQLTNVDNLISTQATSLCKTADTHLYKNSNLKYFSTGEQMYEAILTELKKAKKFIFLEYFIVEDGEFWNSILDILKQKANEGIEVKLIYDDIGCMGTLPGN